VSIKSSGGFIELHWKTENQTAVAIRPSQIISFRAALSGGTCVNFIGGTSMTTSEDYADVWDALGTAEVDTDSVSSFDSYEIPF
jgi:hypothetical protein